MASRLVIMMRAMVKAVSQAWCKSCSVNCSCWELRVSMPVRVAEAYWSMRFMYSSPLI